MIGSISAHRDNSVSRFVENKGQWSEAILYRAEVPNGYMFFHKEGITYLFYEDLLTGHDHAKMTYGSSLPGQRGVPSKEIRLHSVRVTFENGESSEIIAENPASQRYNYFIGNDRRNWASGVRSFGRVTFHEVYPGIDISFYFLNNKLKYDINLAAGADASAIKLKIEGADQLSIDQNQLAVCTSVQDMVELPPFTYQIDQEGVLNEIPTSFSLSENQLSFAVGNYDHDRKLVIDPALVFSTFSGSTADNWGFTATFDNQGNAYSGGIVRQIAGVGGNLPVTTGAFSIAHNGGTWDVALLKYDSLGQDLIYATYLGGTDNEFPHSLVVDNQGDLLVMGSTGSPDFPVTSNGHDLSFNGGFDAQPLKQNLLNFPQGSDIFVAKLSADGSTLKGATYLGGTHNDGIGVRHTSLDGVFLSDEDDLVKNYGDQFRSDIIVDEGDNIYVASSTRSEDFVSVGGFQSYAGGRRDGVVIKLNPDLSSVIWSTFLGGSGEDVIYSIKILNDNRVLVSGGTNSLDFPQTTNALHTTLAGDIDAFVTIISNDGSAVLQSTFLGTSFNDQAYFVDFDSQEDVYVFGQTQGIYPIEGEVFNNPGGGQFIHKLSADLSATIFSTTFGTGIADVNNRIIPNMSPTAFLVSECDNFYISGWGSGQAGFSPQNGYLGMNISGLPLTTDSFQSSAGIGAFYIASFTSDASELLFSTYFGGTVVASHVDGGTSRFDKRGIVYQSVCTCGSNQDDFPTTPGAWSNTNQAFPISTPTGSAPRCNNAIFKYDLATLNAKLQTSRIDGSDVGVSDICLPTSLLFVNKSNGGEEVRWDFGDGTIVNNMDSVTHDYEQVGSYLVTLRIEDLNTCTRVDMAFASIDVFEDSFTLIDNLAICEGASIELTASGGDFYNWTSKPDQIPFSIESSPLVTPSETTEFVVEATSANGCFWRDSVEVRVVPRVTADFEFTKSYECMGFPTFKFTNTSTNSSDASWDLGDGSVITENNLIHQYESNGQFVVGLTANREFCSDLKTEKVISHQLFLPNVITPNGDTFNDFFIIPNDGDLQIDIVNRNGVDVFSSSDYQNDWSANGLSEGVYYYHLTLPDSTECNGLVHVLR